MNCCLPASVWVWRHGLARASARKTLLSALLMVAAASLNTPRGAAQAREEPSDAGVDGSAADGGTAESEAPVSEEGRDRQPSDLDEAEPADSDSAASAPTGAGDPDDSVGPGDPDDSVGAGEPDDNGGGVPRTFDLESFYGSGEVWDLTGGNQETSIASPPSTDSSVDEAAARPASPEDENEEIDGASPDLSDAPPELTIIGFVPRDLFRTAGSVTVLDLESLESLEHSDPHQVLLQVPGLNVRGEDGYGLRPNIGIRGANSDRSSKVTLMEDGVLFGPAPYAAPAAYYFPLINRMVGVEVTKGPASILYGPQTIGGAINLRTREVPSSPTFGFDAALGSNLFGRIHAYGGAQNDWGGLLGEVLHIQTDGFKNLDPTLDADSNTSNADTGFSRTDVMLKGQLFSDRTGSTFHRLQLKLGFSQEGSNETYLGLSDADFRASATRRYRASALDRMEWWRSQVALRYELEVGEQFSLTTTAYRHDFKRSWFRLNRFGDDRFTIRDVLQDPTGARAVFYDVLRGVADTASAPDDSLFVVDNDRRFVSMGIQSSGVLEFDTGPVDQRLELGLRLHFDQVERNHIETEFLMQQGRLVDAGSANIVATDNLGQALAFSGYAAYRATFEGLSVMPGLRFETVSTSLDDDLAGTNQDGTQAVLLPGVGVHYAITDSLAALFGVYRGFSPVAPGQPEGVAPEFAVNWEVGVRYQNPSAGTQIEAIGFYNDYSNILGACTFSSGCDASDLDRQFNGGEATSFGLEVIAAHTLALGPVRFPMRVSYSLTRATFGTSFESDNPQFGTVEKGDQLPYVPTHQGSAQVGVVHDRIETHVQAAYLGQMRETAGQGEDPREPKTDDYLVVNWMTAMNVAAGLQLYLRFENLFNSQPITARRPFGARPLRPFAAQLGVRYDFGG